ncbi:MAG: NAD(P)-binding domain-containing protein [Chloroflexota bacterium]
MKIGIIGAGNIGGSLGKVWSDKGHEIVFGIRDPDSDKTRKALEEIGTTVKAVSLAEAAAFAEVLVLAIPFSAVKETIPLLGNITGKTIIDATNRFTPPQAGESAIGVLDVAKWAAGAHVVKAFSTIGWEVIRNPIFKGVAVATFICGENAEAKETVLSLASDTGLDAVDAGPLENVGALDGLSKLWIYIMQHGGSRDMAFTLIRR